MLKKKHYHETDACSQSVPGSYNGNSDDSQCNGDSRRHIRCREYVPKNSISDAEAAGEHLVNVDDLFYHIIMCCSLGLTRLNYQTGN